MGFRVRGRWVEPPATTTQQGAAVVALLAAATQGYAAGSPNATTHNGAASLVLTANATQAYGNGSITPADITTITFDPTVTGSQLPVTFAQPFAPGDVPAGASIEVVGLTTQFNAMATHADGSVRHAIITALADTTAGVAQILTLRTRTPVSGAAITKANVLASAFSASVTLNVGGTVYTLAARDLLDGTLVPKLDKTHVAGPQCSEFVVGAAVRNGGVPHAHLCAYFHIRAFGSGGVVNRVRCHVVIENGWTFVASPGDVTYTPTIVVGGTTIYNTAITHYDHARTPPIEGWWGGGDPQVYVRHNKIYLQGTQAIPKYADVTPTTGFLNTVRQSITPMDNGDHTDTMDNTGYQDAIGPLPRWDAVYAVSTDKRAFNYMRANAQGGAAYRIHHRDEVTGLPVTIDSYPNATYADPAGSSPVIPVPSTANPHNQGSFTSHQPSIGYTAYLVTGDYYYLEEMQFWSSYNLIWSALSDRRGLPAYGQTSASYGLPYMASVRAIAWFLRSLAQAAYLTPDADTLKSYFVTKLNNNLNYFAWLYPSGNLPEANALGAMYSDEKASTNLYRGFFDHFLTWATQYLVDLGFTNGVAFRDYKVKFPIGLMGLASNECCFQFGSEYNWVLGPDNATYYANFQQVYNATWAGAAAHVCGTQDMANYITSLNIEGQTIGLNGMLGHQDQVGNLFANMEIALAAAADSGVIGGMTAWVRAHLASVHPNYADTPQFAVQPRSQYPAWYAALAPGEWTVFPNSNLDAVAPSPAPPGNVGIAAVMSSWSGGAYDTTRNQLIVWGGGHADSADNSIYTFGPLTSDSPAWSRVDGPTATANVVNDALYYADGKPSARHTYAYLDYAPNMDLFFSMAAGGTYGPSGAFGYKVDSFNFSTLAWKSDWVDTDGNFGSIGSCAAYNPNDGCLWYHATATSPLVKYNPTVGTTGQRTSYATTPSVKEEGMCLLDPVRNRLVLLGSSAGQQLVVWDLNNPNNAGTYPTTSGTAGGIALESVNGPGFQYDPINDLYLAWDGGANVYALNPDTWVWSALASTGVTPTAAQPNGTYGRFRFVPYLPGLVVVNTVTGNVYFRRL